MTDTTKRKKRLTKEQQLQIEEAERKPTAEQLLIDFKDKTIAEIADKYDVRYRTAELWLWEEDITKDKAKGYPEKPTKDELERLYGQNTQKEIAEHYGVPQAVVARWISSYGIRKPDKPYRPIVVRPDPQELIELMATPKEIMERYSVTYNTAKKWIKEAGLYDYFYMDEKPPKEVLDQVRKRVIRDTSFTKEDGLDEFRREYLLPEKEHIIYWLKTDDLWNPDDWGM